MRRIAELDGLRGIAAVLIVAYHLFTDYLPGCWAAVDVFFVLSGFLITGIVLQHGRSAGFLLAFYSAPWIADLADLLLGDRDSRVVRTLE